MPDKEVTVKAPEAHEKEVIARENKKWDALSRDRDLRAALKYIETLIANDSLPGGKGGKLSTEIQIALANLKFGLEDINNDSFNGPSGNDE